MPASDLHVDTETNNSSQFMGGVFIPITTITMASYLSTTSTTTSVTLPIAAATIVSPAGPPGTSIPLTSSTAAAVVNALKDVSKFDPLFPIGNAMHLIATTDTSKFDGIASDIRDLHTSSAEFLGVEKRMSRILFCLRRPVFKLTALRAMH